MIEWHASCAVGFYDEHYVHNFNKLFSPIVPIISSLQDGVWGGKWREYGCVVEANLSEVHPSEQL